MGLIFKIYKELIQLNFRKTPNNLIKKWAEVLNKHFFQRHTDGQQTHKIFKSLIIR